MPRRAKTKPEYQAVGSDRGIDWAGSVLPYNALEHTEWRCRNGHLFSARYNDLQQGHGCPYCSGKAHKRREDYEVLGCRKGFVLIGDIPLTTREKAKWHQPGGKTVFATYHAMSHRKDADGREKLDPAGAGRL